VVAASCCYALTELDDAIEPQAQLQQDDNAKEHDVAADADEGDNDMEDDLIRMVTSRTKRTESYDPLTEAPSKRSSKRQIQQQQISAQLSARNDIALSDCVAHILCDITQIAPLNGHFILTCNMVAAYVKTTYWDGKTFGARTADIPPTLSFLGSQQFAIMTRVDDTDTADATVES